MQYNIINFYITAFLPIIITLCIVIGIILYITIPDIIKRRTRQYYASYEVQAALKSGYFDGIKKGQEIKRRKLLKKAKQFLSPYKSIWQNQTLANSNVKIKLKKKTLILYDKDYQHRYDFQKKEHINLIWNNILENFSENTDFKYLFEFLQDFFKQSSISVKYSAQKKESKVLTFVNKFFKERTVDV